MTLRPRQWTWKYYSRSIEKRCKLSEEATMALPLLVLSLISVAGGQDCSECPFFQFPGRVLTGWKLFLGSPVSVIPSSFNLREIWEKVPAANELRTDSRVLHLTWPLPKKISLIERFVLRFTDVKAEELLRVRKSECLLLTNVCNFNFFCVFELCCSLAMVIWS